MVTVAYTLYQKVDKKSLTPFLPLDRIPISNSGPLTLMQWARKERKMGYAKICLLCSSNEDTVDRFFDSLIARAVREASWGDFALGLDRGSLCGTYLRVTTLSGSCTYSLRAYEIRSEGEGSVEFGIVAELNGSILGGVASMTGVFPLPPMEGWEVLEISSSMEGEILGYLGGQITLAEYASAVEKKHHHGDE